MIRLDSLAHVSEVECIPVCECISAVVPVSILWFVKWCRSHQQESCVVLFLLPLLMSAYITAKIIIFQSADRF
jgi:hypothetical protein